MINLLAPLRRFLRAARRLHPASPKPKSRAVYPGYRWRALEATFIGYATFYLLARQQRFRSSPSKCRNRCGYTKTMIGNIGAITALTYGLSKFVMGAVSDRSDARKFMATGLLLTALCNFAFGASTELSGPLLAVGPQRLLPGHGLAAVRPRHGPLVQRIGTRAHVQHLEHFAQRRRRHRRRARRLGRHNIRRLAVRLLRARRHRNGRRRLSVRATARHAAIGRPAADRGVSQRLSRWRNAAKSTSNANLRSANCSSTRCCSTHTCGCWRSPISSPTSPATACSIGGRRTCAKLKGATLDEGGAGAHGHRIRRHPVDDLLRLALRSHRRPPRHGRHALHAADHRRVRRHHRHAARLPVARLT